MAASILDLLNVPREMTLEFLATFARFEFALKKAGYARGDDSQVSANWDAFTNDVAKIDAAVLAPVLASSQYVQQYPPKKQILDHGVIRWVARQGTSGSAIGDVLLSVRTVRNNVFHGGKFPDGAVAEPLRDETLIRECVVVLQGLLELPLPKNVEGIFRTGI